MGFEERRAQLTAVGRAWLLFLLDTALLALQLVWAVAVQLYHAVVPHRERELAGEVAVVTGAGRGIGRELALQLAAAGVRVACWDCDKAGADRTAELVERAGGQALPLVVDVSEREAVRRAASSTRQQLGEVSLLFNNAGIMPCKATPLLSHSPVEVERIFSVNVFSQYWTVMEFLPRMISLGRGHITSICSMAGVTGTPNLVPYCSSKFAVKGFMDALFLEMRATRPDCKVGFTTILPFVVDTGLAKKPRSRFQSLIPFTPAAVAAARTISATRSGLEYEFIPSGLCLLTAISKLLPRAAQLAIIDYLDCACDPHDD